MDEFLRFSPKIPDVNSPSPSWLALLLHVVVRTHTKALLRKGLSSSNQLLADEGVDERGMGCPAALKSTLRWKYSKKSCEVEQELAQPHL